MPSDALSQRRISEQWRWWESISIVVTDLATGQFTEQRIYSNTIVNTGLNLMRDALGGYLTDAAIHYVAIGTSATAVAATDTQLGAEVFRKVLTSQSQIAQSQLQTIMYLGPSDSVGTVIAEIGWFAGATATATANSGILVSHVLYRHTHTGSESLQFTRTDTL